VTIITSNAVTPWRLLTTAVRRGPDEHVHLLSCRLAPPCRPIRNRSSRSLTSAGRRRPDEDVHLLSPLSVCTLPSDHDRPTAPARSTPTGPTPVDRSDETVIQHSGSHGTHIQPKTTEIN
jgi:hypothetical protein